MVRAVVTAISLITTVTVMAGAFTALGRAADHEVVGLSIREHSAEMQYAAPQQFRGQWSAPTQNAR